MPTRFAHLWALIDDVGIWQHATGATPARQHGYCLDDAARAMHVTARLCATDHTWRPALETCRRFVDAAIAPAGGARNFLDADGNWLDDPHWGDHVGRTIWALGALRAGTDDELGSWAAPHLRRLLDADLLEASALHARLYTLLGMAAVAEPWMEPLARQQLERIVAAVADGGPAWPWPESTIRYDAGRVPEALLVAGSAFDVPAAIDAGCATLSLLTAVAVQHSGVHRYPGHRGLAPDAPLEASGDEQPLEAAAFAAAHVAAHRATASPTSPPVARAALAWFHGANRLGMPLVDPGTDGCHDGLGEEDRNHNQGAESMLAYVATCLDVADLELTVQR